MKLNEARCSSSATYSARFFFTMLIAALALAALAITIPLTRAQAATGDLDEIINYTITVDVNDDATLDMVYHIDWLVLDSTSDGPLTWVRVGIPNKHYVSLEPLSSTIDDISYSSSSGGCARIDLDRAYRAGEIASFDFKLAQDYMYQANRDNEGETVFEFTPGWFDDIEVDNLVVRWSADKVERIAPAAQQEGDYYVWRTSLGKRQRYTVTVAYPNNAYAFDISKTIEQGSSSSSDDDNDWIYGLIGLAVLAFMGWASVSIFLGVIRAITSLFTRTSGFSSGKKKITRTKVVYYPTCPGCGAAREEGKETCSYCGRSMIQSEEKVTEEDLPPEENAIRGKDTDGLYAYSSQPNTYLRVHVVPVPVVHSTRSHSSCAHSSCAHSSCACACGCACACACAGGGRAGCTAKDFYNTDLKLRQLELK